MLKYNYVTNYKMTIFNNNYYYNFNTINISYDVYFNLYYNTCKLIFN